MTALRDRRERENTGLFCFEGVHLLEELLRAGKTPDRVFVREDVIEKYSQLIKNVGCEVYEVTTSVYDKLTDEKAPQGIFTVSPYLDNVHLVGKDIELSELSNKINSNLVMLADIQDTGNAGTIIRTAAAMGCDVILAGKCADVYSQKTVRATMGALFTNDVYICPDTVSVINALREGKRRVIASALNESACVLGEFQIKDTDCFVIGNEGQGLSDEVIKSCDMTAFIPMSGRTESLNAASAAAMLLWEAKRGKSI